MPAAPGASPKHRAAWGADGDPRGWEEEDLGLSPATQLSLATPEGPEHSSFK